MIKRWIEERPIDDRPAFRCFSIAVRVIAGLAGMVGFITPLFLGIALWNDYEASGGGAAEALQLVALCAGYPMWMLFVVQDRIAEEVQAWEMAKWLVVGVAVGCLSIWIDGFLIPAMWFMAAPIAIAGLHGSLSGRG